MTDERKALVERLRTRLFGYPAENQRLKLVVDESADQIETDGKRIAELEARIAELEQGISDPNAVHVNLLRNTIARPTVHQMIHIYSPAKVRDGLETYARAALAGKGEA
jgi:cell division protein FtsB